MSERLCPIGSESESELPVLVFLKKSVLHFMDFIYFCTHIFIHIQNTS